MAATHNLPQSSASPQISKHGVLTLYGFGVRVTMHTGHLEIEDGVGMERRKIKLAKVGHGLKRLICISEDGFVTLSALKWLSDVGASFIMLDRMGKVLFVTGPSAPSDARLRRAQSLAFGNGTALLIAKELIEAKLQGQERLVRNDLQNSSTADAIAVFRARLADAENLDTVRVLEAHAAVAYFGTFGGIRVQWPKSDLRKIPTHWLQVGPRHSVLSHSPRLAISPAHSILNYCFALLESEGRLALSALGLDPSIGFLHLDRANRDSLALDVIEPVRADVERWLCRWISTEPLRRSDFHETSTGNVRLMSHLCCRLSETAPVWRRLIAPWAERISFLLWASTSRSKPQHRIVPPATRLTQSRRREVKRSTAPSIQLPKPEHVCSDCGIKIRNRKKLCLNCAKQATRKNFRLGRKRAQQAEYLAKRAETMRTHRRAIQDWDPSRLPAWLTVDVYVKQIQPALATVAKSQIRSALGVSEPYSSDIRAGRRRPHPRHWQPLALLVGVSPDAPA
jgi:CRISPR-associated endonuclease Cas1